MPTLVDLGGGLIVDRDKQLLALDRVDCEESLAEFVRHFWHVIEPATPLRWGWIMDAICEHLEAVAYGDITRLLINCPPGASKSILVNCFFPAWVWAKWPHKRFLAFSYAAHLTERDNRRFLEVIRSPRYQAMFGDRFDLRKRGEENVSNDKMGFKVATSVGGVGTGERGDFVLCFPGDEIVQTEQGPIPIGRIVKEKMALRVWSLGPLGLELKPITAWRHNPGDDLVRLEMEGGSVLTCTPCHKIMTAAGYVEARRLVAGNFLCAASSGMFVAPADVAITQLQVQMPPLPAIPNAADGSHANTKFLRKCLRAILMTGCNLADHLLGQVRRTIFESAVALAVRNVLSAGSVFQIIPAGVGPVSVSMANFLAVRTRSDECIGNQLMAETVNRLSIYPERDARVSFIHSPGHDSARNSHMVAAPHGDARNAPNSSKATHLVQAGKADDGQPHFVRLRSIERCGHAEETFCLTVADNHNMLCGHGGQSIVCSNCDDPHNVKDNESEVIRKGTVEWFKTAMSNRLNDMQRSSIVVIMQRVHEEDVSGYILENCPEYTHLCIPAEYEPDRHCSTSIGWEDPRTEIGESFWEERFPVDPVLNIEKRKGPFYWSGQFQQRPDPVGGGIIMRDWWQLWEDKAFPPMDYIMASLDTAYTEKEENDECAMTIWGVFSMDPTAQASRMLSAAGVPMYLNRSFNQTAPKVMLMYAWAERVQFHDLVTKVAEICKRYRVDKLLIENKAAGISCAQELRRLHGHEPWDVALNDPKSQDKTARLYSVQHIFADGTIYAPERSWSDRVITQCAQFPKARNDDLVDTVSQALRKLREMGMLQRASEVSADLQESMKYNGSSPAPLYPA